MRSAAIILSIALSFASLQKVNAQQLNLPFPSPKGEVSQVVGLTDVKVIYSRPQAKGRTIWDSLVPYGKLWRTGANSATTFETSDDITVEGQKLPKGKYSVFTIPAKDEWTVIFNKNFNQGGTDNYKQDEDALRVKVKPAKAADYTQTLTFTFADLEPSSTTMVIDWAGIKVPVKIKADLDAVAGENIKKATENAWMNFARGANYYLQSGNLVKAEELINKSLALNDDYYNHWVKAQILAKNGNFKDALTHAEKSAELGAKAGPDSNYRFNKDAIEKAITEYKSKAGKPDTKKKK
jgi:hypothetical protein